MAGIGFSLRKILRRDSFTGIAAAYSVAGMISGGPWIISVFSIILLSIVISLVPAYQQSITAFQISITYLVATSLLLSGFAGDSFARYAADQLFLNRSTYVMSNLNGLLLIMTSIAGTFSFLIVLFLFPHETVIYRLLFMGCFVVLSNIWIVVTLLTGLKDYKIILRAFFISDLIIIGLVFSLRQLGLDAFMFGFLLGQLVLIFLLLVALYKEYPTNTLISFHFLQKNSLHRTLLLTGMFFNAGVWVDKFIFWYSPSTSYPVIGPLRASWFYDLPIFIAYLTSLPGMAVFLLLIETNFSEYYERFHSAIRNGQSLDFIHIQGQKMINYALDVIFSIMKVQAIIIILAFQFGERVLFLTHIPILYMNILYVAMIGTSIQLILLAIMSLLFHMDRLINVLTLSILFFSLNLIFTLISIQLGPLYYGFGFTCALMITCTYGMYLLDQEFSNLEYKIIMLR